VSVARAFCLCALLALTGCVDPEPGQSLYVYDDASNTVLVWDHVEDLAKAAEGGKALPVAERKITASLLSSFNLAWGGLGLDPFRHRLYLVSEGGKVVVIPQVDNRTGTLANRNEIHSFQLGEAGRDRLSSGSLFGQVAVDAQHDVLYVLETARDGSAARLWHVPKASTVQDQATVALANHTFHVQGDRRGVGVAADPSSGTVYGLFAGGDSIRSGHGDEHSGPRLRQGRTMGPNGAFPTHSHHNHGQNLLIGDKTQLTKALRYGSLAFDGRHHELYVLARGAGLDKLLVFNTGLFSGNLNHEPSRTLDHAPADLRLLAHASDSDFMVGAASGTAAKGKDGDESDDEDLNQSKKQSLGRGPGLDKLYLWQEPNNGKAPLLIRSLPGAKRIRGLALAGH